MLVPVVQVRIVRMTVRQRPVTVPMHVRFTRRVVRPMRVPVMRVVMVTMLVLDRIVRVPVFMPFGDVKPHPGRHE